MGRRIKKHHRNTSNLKNKEQPQNTNSVIYNYKFGHKNIRLTVEKIEVLKKSTITDAIFYYHCLFCNQDFDSSAGICPVCNRPLAKVSLKKCEHCGAKNSLEKQNCWICNNAFAKLAEKTDQETQWLLTLNIDGNLYRNTDKILRAGTKKLFEDLVASGFSKEPLETWVKVHDQEIEHLNESIREEFKHLTRETKLKNLAYMVALVILPVIICLMLAVVFWPK